MKEKEQIINNIKLINTKINSLERIIGDKMKRYTKREGEYGSIFSLFQLKEESFPYLTSLNVIINNFLKVIIADTLSTSHSIIEVYMNFENSKNFYKYFIIVL